MTYSQTVNTRTKNHSLRMEYREKAYVSGVDDVDSFNDTSVNMITSAGKLVIEGVDLHITNLNLDEGQVIIEGTITSTRYEDDSIEKGSFLSSIFK